MRITNSGQEGTRSIESKTDPQIFRATAAGREPLGSADRRLPASICSAVGLRPLLSATGDEAPRVAGLRPSLACSDVELVLVEDALVESRGKADVGDVTLLEVHAAAELATRHVRVLAHQCLE